MKTLNKKTTRAKLNVNWPTEAFTINDLQNQHPGAVNITLRFRVNKALENNEIVRVGHNTGKAGRPTLVFVKANPSKDALVKLKSSGVILEEQFERVLAPSVQIKSEVAVPQAPVVPVTQPAPAVTVSKKTVTA